jgi:predicted O-methyltransferase YrrM
LVGYASIEETGETTMHEQWTSVDNYFSDLFTLTDPVFEAALKASDEGGLPTIQVAPNQGKLLALFARRILEIGTLGGYSSIWMARTLPADGKLITLELETKHAEVALANLARAGLAEKVEVRVGKALHSLAQLHAEGQEPFDMVFIDADKVHSAEYFEWALKMTRPGSLILVDNVVRNGAVTDGQSSDASVQGTRRVLEMMSQEPRVSVTALQTVGSKGYDGLAIALVVG